MKKLIIIPIIFICLILSANTYYVSTTGTDSRTKAQAKVITTPWASFQTAIDSAVAGDTVFFRGGTYYTTLRTYIDPTNNHGHSGTLANPIVYMSYPGEWAIFDCKENCHSVTGYNSFLIIQYAEHLVFKDFEIRNVYLCGTTENAAIDCSWSRNMTFNHIIVHNIGTPRGFWIISGAWKSWYDSGGTSDIPYWPDSVDTTRFINCDAYDLCDTIGGGNAGDAFFPMTYKGNYFLFDGCRAWNYSDDGYDIHTTNGGENVFRNCWAMASNKYEVFDIEGNGWKISAHQDVTPPSATKDYVFTNCMAVFCSGSGFYNNIFYGGLNFYEDSAIFYNNTIFKCGYGILEGKTGDSYSIYKNNLSYASVNKAAGSGADLNWMGNVTSSIESHNTWDFKVDYPWSEDTDTVTVTNADFVTVDSATIVSLFTAPRQADGSLPINKPLQLVVGSDLVDAGKEDAMFISLGLTHNSTAPDIGYAEYGTADITATDITAFGFANQVGVSVVNATTHTVTGVLAAGQNITTVVATFSLSSGATAKVGATSQISGVTSNDFTAAVTYAITAEDGVTLQNWTVTITLDANPVPEVATVATNSASYTAVTANVTGRIYSANGGTLTTRGVCYSTSASPTTSDRHTEYSPYVGTFTDKIRGLKGGTTYNVRAYASTAEGGTSYGDNISFKTDAFNIVKESGKIIKQNGKIIIGR